MCDDAPAASSSSDEQAEAAAKIQAINRGKKDREKVQDMKDQKNAAVKIQSINRGKQDRTAARGLMSIRYPRADCGLHITR
jgi:hypothetical protein